MSTLWYHIEGYTLILYGVTLGCKMYKYTHTVTASGDERVGLTVTASGGERGWDLLSQHLVMREGGTYCHSICW